MVVEDVCYYYNKKTRNKYNDLEEMNFLLTYDLGVLSVEKIHEILTLIYLDEILEFVYDTKLYKIRKLNSEVYILERKCNQNSYDSWPPMSSITLYLSKIELLDVIFVVDFENLNNFYNNLKTMKPCNLLESSISFSISSATIIYNGYYILRSVSDFYDVWSDLNDISSFQTFKKSEMKTLFKLDFFKKNK